MRSAAPDPGHISHSRAPRGVDSVVDCQGDRWDMQSDGRWLCAREGVGPVDWSYLLAEFGPAVAVCPHCEYMTDDVRRKKLCSECRGLGVYGSILRAVKW